MAEGYFTAGPPPFQLSSSPVVTEVGPVSLLAFWSGGVGVTPSGDPEPEVDTAKWIPTFYRRKARR